MKFTKLAVASAVVSAFAVAAMPATASAWKVNYNADSVCKDEKAVISWSFKNQEPNQAKWSIDLNVTDSQTGKSQSKTVKPGETVSGSIATDKTKLNTGQLSFKMTWTDGRNGIDTRTSSYKATDECYIPKVVEPDFEASVACKVVDGKAVYKLNVKQTAGDKTLTFTPKNDTTLNDGKAVQVVGMDNQGKKIIKTTKAVADCTPEKKPEVKATTTELPNTGAGSVAGLMGATLAGGTAIAQLRLRKKTNR